MSIYDIIAQSFYTLKQQYLTDSIRLLVICYNITYKAPHIFQEYKMNDPRLPVTVLSGFLGAGKLLY